MLMQRNISSRGFSVEDPLNPGHFSAPGCVIASPSFPQNLDTVDQDYVFNWTRDAAITAMELAAAALPTVGGVCEPLVDYATFAATCQAGAPTIDRACYTIEGAPRDWSNQSDGPALQTSAALRAYDQLGAAGQQTARQVIATNVAFLLDSYQQPTTNLWEEVVGYSFFARAVQLRCFTDLAANTAGVPVPAGVTEAVDWLRAALDRHWDGEVFVSVLAADQDPPVSARAGYDANIDIALAALYGGIPVTDSRVLATAARLRRQWADPASTVYYPINGADAARGIGPLLGRYPDDTYDGDVTEPVLGGHPWPVSTACLADLYYRVAAHVATAGAVGIDPLSAPFFTQIGIDATTTPAGAVTALAAAGNRMLNAVLFHSDYLQLSEQFDGTTGYEKSVANLTWSYASFLSAARSRRAVPAP
jgi:glucoamylase